jgi:hypothetical protein
MADADLSVIAWGVDPPPIRARLVKKNRAANTAPLITKRPRSFLMGLLSRQDAKHAKGDQIIIFPKLGAFAALRES